MKTKITKIIVNRTNKEGEPYVSSYTNKEQAKVAIQIDAPEFEGKWLSNFVELGDPIEQWKIGQPIDIIATQKGSYWNFKVAKGGTTGVSAGQLQKEINDLKKRIENLENFTGYSEMVMTENPKVEHP